jgi:hypothetical protein
MKTEIFPNYDAFLARPDKAVNGVSPEFAAENPSYGEERNNSGCYDCSRCSDCSDCSDCYNCSDCSGCSGCSGCYDCSRCSRCSDMAPMKLGTAIQIPVIPNIHASVLTAVQGKGALDMSEWHTCETTHCRAGWVVTLAGEAGRKLEERTSTLFAAMRIYKESSPIRVSPVRFFDNNEKAMEDIQRCAQDEQSAKTGKI